jgi:hypothetical protein
MSHGGKWERAGRKAGVPSSKTVKRLALAKLIAENDVTPLQIMYKNMQIWDQQADENDVIVEQLSAEDIKGMEPDEA